MNPTGTKTTRLSAKDPNGQNVGTGKDPFGDSSGLKPLLRDLDIRPRKFFVPEPGYFILSVDYSQLQLAIFAQLSGEPDMVAALLAGEDLHEFTARRIYSLPPGKKPDKGQRTVGKNINFGFIFGAGEEKMRASTAGVTGLKRLLSKRFPHATDFISKNKRDAEQYGFVLTPGGYPLQVPHDRTYAATNFIVQGAEGEIVKLAMAACRKAFVQLPYEQRPSLLLQVHDECDFRIPYSNVSIIPDICSLLVRAGEHFGFELEVEATICPNNWAEGFKWSPQLQPQLVSWAEESLGRVPQHNQSTLTRLLSSSNTSA
jgi:DNA polymerase-1